MQLFESGENYLETILLLQNKNGVVRAVDIAAQLSFSKPSISRAMSVLRVSGYIEVNGGAILLTQKGKDKAEAIYRRHNIIKAYFIKALGINEQTATTNACKIEHFLSEEIITAMERKT